MIQLPAKLRICNMVRPGASAEEIERRERYAVNELFLKLADNIPRSRPIVVLVTTKRRVIQDVPETWPEAGCTEITVACEVSNP